MSLEKVFWNGNLVHSNPLQIQTITRKASFSYMKSSNRFSVVLNLQNQQKSKLICRRENFTIIIKWLLYGCLNIASSSSSFFSNNHMPFQGKKFGVSFYFIHFFHYVSHKFTHISHLFVFSFAYLLHSYFFRSPHSSVSSHSLLSVSLIFIY